MIKKQQLDNDIDQMFPIQLGQTYFYNGQEVLVLEPSVVDGVAGFKVSVVGSSAVKFVSNGELKTKAELNQKTEE